MKARPRAVGVVGLLAGMATLFALPASSFADSATITGANINASGTQVSVTNVEVQFDTCGGSDLFAGIGGCGGMAGVVPAASTCPSDGVGVQQLWKEGPVSYISVAERTFNSGARSVSVSNPVAYRVCAYSIDVNSGGSIIPAGEATRLRADAVTPAPDPTPVDPTPPSTNDEACNAAQSNLDAAKTKLKKAKKKVKKAKKNGTDAQVKKAKKKVKKAKKKVNRAKADVAEACA